MLSKLKRFLESPILKISWIVLIIIFSFIYIDRKANDIKQILTSFNFFRLLLAFILIMLSKLLLVVNQKFSQQSFNRNLNYKQNLSIYGFSQMAKYIPGSIWQFLGKANEYKRLRINGNSIKKSIPTEIGFILLGSVLAGMFFLLISLSLETWFWFIVLFFLIFLFTRVASKILKKVIFLHLLIWSILGSSVYLLIEPFLNISSLMALLSTIAFNALSFAAGYVSVFAPGGIGVREALLSVTLSNFSELDLIFIIGMHRLLYFFAELIFFIYSLIVIRFEKNQETSL